jgi:hypothetical protein
MLAPALVVALLCCSAAGCGSNYRAEVEKTRQRMALLDEENTLLEGPARLIERDAATYFRPPRGVSVRPSAKAHPPSDWMQHLPWSDSRALVPPLEVIVGAVKKTPDERLEEFLQAKVLTYLRLHADERLTPRSGESPREITLLRQTDPPQEQRPTTFQCFPFRTEQETPQWPAPERTRVPHGCVYHYDIYLADNGEFWGAVVFKSLAIEATLESWRKAKVGTEMMQRLPQKSLLVTDTVTGLNPRECSLATLIVGARARARLRLASP